MRFYVEFKNPEIADYYYEIVCENEYIPWTDELRKLIELHRMYREWLKENSEASQAPQNIIDELNAMTQIYAFLEGNIVDVFYGRDKNEAELDDWLREEVEIARRRSGLKEEGSPSYYHLYPGLKAEDYYTDDTSIAVLRFDTDFDLEAIANNEQGIPTNEELINKLAPKCKWISGRLDLPIELSQEELEEEESGQRDSGYWWYIARDVDVRIAGMRLEAYMPYGAKAFYMEKENS